MKEIIIKLSDEQYNAVIRNAGWVGNDLYHAVKNGTQLPKGHGRIVDIDKILDEMKATRTYDIPFVLERIKPIIEADKAESEVTI